MGKLLGDAVADVLQKTGVAKIARRGCTGCASRQKQLNRLHRKLRGAIPNGSVPLYVQPDGSVGRKPPDTD